MTVMKGTSGNPGNSVTTWDGSQNHANGVVVVGSWPAFRLEIGNPPISRGGVRRQVGDARAAMAYFRQKLAVFGDDFRGLAMTQAVVLRNALIDNGMDNPKVMEAAMSDPDGDLITLVFGGEWQGCTWSGGAGVRRP